MTEIPPPFLHRQTEKIIQRLKRDRNYQLDPNMMIRDLVEVLSYRGLAILRGFCLHWQLAQSGKITFIGRRVTLRHKKKISLGKSNIIEDDVFINALSKQGIILGNNVTIAKFSTIQGTGVIQELGVGLEIGDNSAIGAYSFLGCQGGIKIGDNVIMGPKVCIFSENHGFHELDTPIRLQPNSRKGVVIDNDCWIGAGAIILDGVHIHSGVVVAAGSIVTKDIPPNVVVGGNPAQIIKKR